MLILITLLALGAEFPSADPLAPVDGPRVVQCTAHNTEAGKDRKCHVRIPRGSSVRPCGATDKLAGRCALDARVVAWTAAENGARCKVSKKKTDWKTRVTVKVAKTTKPGAGRCTLFVGVQ